MNRRDAMRLGVCGVVGVALPRGRGFSAPEPAEAGTPERLTREEIEQRICLFTDHLDEFGYGFDDLARMLAPLGIAGADLTVRPGGFVSPDAVAEELPRAARALGDRGLSIPMISTGLTTADASAAATFRAMHALGIRYYKLGYYPYGDVGDWQAAIAQTRASVAGLVELGREFQVIGGFHNHAGAFVGGALWDSWEVLGPLDATRVGFYFDPAQATLEGGNHAWRLNLERVRPRLMMVAVKDVVWEKTGGAWHSRWVPLGEGMVDWPAFFSMLAGLPFPGPLSLHIEYDPGGSTRAGRADNSLAAAERDLAFLRRELDAAFGPADAL